MALKLDFGKLPWHAQLGTMVAIALAGVGAFWYFYASPAQATLETKRAEVAKLQLQIKNGLATAKRLPEFRREVTVLEAQLDRLRTVLPEEQDVADLLRRVQAMATQSNLKISGFTPAAVTRRELHAEWPIGLKLEGNYHDIGAFLERVSKFPRIINVGAIHIAARTEQTSLNTVTAECTAMTFVLVNDKPAGKGKAAPNGKKA
ncbi:MAG TPA: type 4a pilus biogenesis protein PilO [Vicinamibacterales bacterium]|nr:type 4a pilus biogenesis protein PilO [Vicinamibacterales bacterium]